MIVVFITGVLTGCEPAADWVVVPGDNPVVTLPALTSAQRAAFARGDARFELAFTEGEGLGPVYARPACASCHADDGRGPGVVTRMATVAEDGATPRPDPETLAWGTMERPLVAGGASTPILAPEPAPGLLVSRRAPPPVFGRGWVEAVAEEAVLAGAAWQAASHPGQAGRPAWVPWQSAPHPGAWHGLEPDGLLVLGRFGLKGRISTLDEFAADALQGDMSITSPLRPFELPNPDALADDLRVGVDLDVAAVEDLATYMRLLDIPPRPDADPVGEALFESIGCAVCHTPSLPTDARSPAPQLREAEAWLYSDLLLHDLGPEHADGLDDHGAGSTWWKTAPLVGVRFQSTLLHDGRARDVEEAVLLHGGPGSQAETATDAYLNLDDPDRAALIAFVSSL